VRVVVDANVIALVALSGGDLGPLAGHDLAAPPLLLSEVVSAIRELAWRGEIPRDRGREALRHLRSIAIDVERPADLGERAWDIAEALGWAKTYDAEYVALAQALDVPLVTLDTRLQRGAGELITILGPEALR
jgi:predicted nucleic acid-binding protein